MRRNPFFLLLAMLGLPAWSQSSVLPEDAARAQRRLELRHAIESQRAAPGQRDAIDPKGASLSAEQRAQLREELRRQSAGHRPESVGPRRERP